MQNRLIGSLCWNFDVEEGKNLEKKILKQFAKFIFLFQLYQIILKWLKFYLEYYVDKFYSFTVYELWNIVHTNALFKPIF